MISMFQWAWQEEAGAIKNRGVYLMPSWWMKVKTEVNAAGRYWHLGYCGIWPLITLYCQSNDTLDALRDANLS